MIESTKKIKYHLIFPLVSAVWKWVSAKRAASLPETPFVFIIGSGRNGSTLLASLLNQHPDFFCPPEQYALPYGHMKWIFESEKKWAQTAKKWTQQLVNNNQNWDFDPKAQEEVNILLSQLPEKEQNISFAYLKTLEYLSKKQGVEATIFGDQSPLSTFFSELMLDMYPRARFVFLTRDPRDVALSYKKLEGHPAQDAKYAAKKWVEAQRQAALISRKAPKQILKITYESLVSDPSKTLGEVNEFIGLRPFSYSTNGSSENAAGSVSLSHHSNLNKPISTRSIGLWKEHLSAADLAVVEKISGDFLKNA